jgi:hypothetical protein
LSKLQLNKNLACSRKLLIYPHPQTPVILDMKIAAIKQEIISKGQALFRAIFPLFLKKKFIIASGGERVFATRKL